MNYRRCVAALALGVWAGMPTPATATSADLNGVWRAAHDDTTLRTRDGTLPPLTPQAQEVYQAHVAARRRGDVSFDTTESTCASPGMPRALYLPYPFELVQTPRDIVFVFGWNHLYRRVAIDTTGTATPKPLYPTAMGTAAAHWQGETLIIETTGRMDRTLLDEALPNSDALHVIEHIRLVQGGRVLEDRLTIEDAKTFTHPWETVMRFNRLSNAQIHEDVCVERLRKGGPAIENAAGVADVMTASSAGPPPPAVAAAPAPGTIPFHVETSEADPPLPAGAAPPSADPRDFSGVWMTLHFTTQLRTVQGEALPLNAAGQNLWWHRRAMEAAGTPIVQPGTICEPPGKFIDLNHGTFPFRVVQSPSRVLLLFEEAHSVWEIFLNERHPTHMISSYGGHAVGHWEGNTLVVDLAGLNAKTWLDLGGTPHSDALHSLMRISKVEQGRALQFLISVEDPGMYREPFTVVRTARWHPDIEVLEYDCEATPLRENSVGHIFEE